MRIVFLVFMFLMAVTVKAQQRPDTLRLTLPAAESSFFQNNLLLLAQKFNVDAASALVIQARLWSNPEFNVSQGAYNTQTKQWFSFDKNNGETAFSADQLILLAGKIRKQTNIAKSNVQLADFTLRDVLRTLRFTLRGDFYTIYYLQQTALVYDEEIASMQAISAAFEEQSGKGYLAETEVVRIKAQLYSLKSEYNDLVNQINDKESELRLLLQAAPAVYVVPKPDTLTLEQQTAMQYPLQALLDSAYRNRTDLKLAQINTTLSEQNYTYQKALAVPDITAGVSYDKSGSYIQNFNAVSLGFNIPIFNRNQGNIKSAKIMIDYNKTVQQSTQKALEEQVSRGLQKAIDADKLYRDIDPAFAGEFSKLSNAVRDNYLKRNISLLDFLNFYDSYKENIVQLNNILLNKASALESLNFLTGTDFFNK